MSLINIIGADKLPRDVRDFLETSRGRDAASDFLRRADSYGSAENKALEAVKTFGASQSGIDTIVRFLRSKM